MSFLRAAAAAPLGLALLSCAAESGRVRRSSHGFEYEHLGAAAAAPTIIYIPGGPGGTSIGADPAALGLPSTHPVILTDPRGVGANAALALDPAFAPSTAVVARDVLAVVRSAGLAEYILFGTSYGTVVATVAASLAPALGLPSPTAVVLAGTVHAQVTASASAHSRPPALGSSYFHRQVFCRELAPVALPYCGGITRDAPYSSASHQTGVPLYYFTGTADAMTPPSDTHAHFAGQHTSPRKWLVSLPHVAHTFPSRRLAPCIDAFWSAVSHAASPDDALAPCL